MGNPVVVVPMNDDLSAGHITGHVMFCSHRLSLLQANVANAIVSGDKAANAVSPIVDNNEFPVGVILAQEMADGLGREETPVGGGHDARDQWIRGADLRPYFLLRPDDG